MSRFLLALTLSFGLAIPAQAEVDFDGVDDYVDVGTGLDQNGPVTISAWIYWKSNVGRQEILSNSDSAGGAIDYAFEVNRTANRLSLLRSNEVVTVTGNTDVSLNTWHHVVGVLSGSSGSWTGTLYLDGSSNGSATDTNNPSGTNQSTSIGRLGENNGSYFNGLIDDVRIYSRALSAAEILELYSSRLKYHDVTGAAPVGYWPLDDCADGTSGDGDTFVDRSGSGNNGTGDDGANNTGLVCRAESYLSYPGSVQ